MGGAWGVNEAGCDIITFINAVDSKISSSKRI